MLSMPGVEPLATCTLPVLGVCYLLLTYWGVLRFPRSASAWRARARHVQLQRAPATCAPQWSNIVRIATASRTLALERKRPVKPTELFELFKEFKVGVPKLGNVPTQTVHRMHVPFDRYTQALHMSKDIGGAGKHTGHTRGTHARAHTGTRITNHPNPPTHPHARPHDD
jgi:hypothetical protein